MYVCPQCACLYPTAAPCLVDGATPTSSAADPMIGAMLGSYRVAAKLGSGGMGSVYRAVHPVLGSWVAIKILSHESTGDPEVVSRFFDEARCVNLIRHESIVNILDLAQLPDGRPYIVMEYLEGTSLRVAVRRGPMQPAEACRIAIAALDALAAAHERGVLHRDLKPDNILLSPRGAVTLVDFGVAKVSIRAMRRTATGVILGTPEYMSPEQAQGREVGGSTDLYALGIVLYEMLTGRRPYGGGSLFETLRQQIEDAPRPPSTFVPLPAELEQLVLTAIAKDPRHRHPSARAMQAALHTCVVNSTAKHWAPDRWPRVSIAPTSVTVSHRGGSEPSLSAQTRGPTVVDRPSGRESGPLAHASPLSMVVAPPARAGIQSRLRGRITLAIGGAVWIGIALIASRSSAPAPTAASVPPSVGAPSLPAGAPIERADFSTTPVAAVAACQLLQPQLEAVLACGGIDLMLRRRMRRVYLDLTTRSPDGSWCGGGLDEARRYLVDGGCAAGVTAPVTPVASGPNPCDEFEQATLRFDSCAAIPKASRDSMKEAGASMRRLWASPTTPPEARASIAKSCKDATVSILNSACPK